MFKITATGGQPAKTVSYFGYHYLVPKPYKYIATDVTGNVYCYKEKPVINDNHKVVWQPQTPAVISLGRVSFEGDWKDSLMEIE